MAKFKSYLYESESQFNALLADSKNLDNCHTITIEAENMSQAIQDTLELMECEETYDPYKIYATVEIH